MKRYCADCLEPVASGCEICPSCGSARVVEEGRFFITFSGKKTSRAAFLVKAAEGLRIKDDKSVSFMRTENEIPFPLREQSIRKGFSRSTFFGQKLPCAFCFVLGWLSAWGAWAIDSGRFSGGSGSLSPRGAILLFLGTFFIVFSLVLLVDFAVRKRRSLFMNSHGQDGYVRFTKEQAEEALSLVHSALLSHRGIRFDPLRTKRLVIREFAFMDAQALVDMTNRGDFCRYLGLEPIPDLASAQERIANDRKEYENGQFYRLAITLAGTRTVIGFIGVSRLHQGPRQAEVVYGLDSTQQKKGYMHEALVSFCARLRGKEGMETICATRMVANSSSGAVLLSAGFKRDKRFDAMMVIHGENVPIIGYLLPEEASS